jgi:predicted TPR repeat methyltransferase
MNFFSFKSAAERYAKGRPNIHADVIRRVAEKLKITSPLRNALDIGCGTGLSTVALLPIAGNIFGLDPSADMLHCARSMKESGISSARVNGFPSTTVPSTSSPSHPRFTGWTRPNC